MNIPSNRHASFNHYIGYIDGNAASAVTLSVSKYGARIDNVETKKTYSRKGFGSAITLHAMQQAKLLGYKYCCLDASDEGLNMYKKIGFNECYENKIYG